MQNKVLSIHEDFGDERKLSLTKFANKLLREEEQPI
jgi:hypothetical protein